MKRHFIFLIGFITLISNAQAVILPKEIETPSGLKAWYLYDPETPVISMKFAFRGGARLDPGGKERTALMIASLLSDGTAEKTPKEFSEYQQDFALTIDFSANADFLSGQVTMLNKYKDQAFSLLREVFTSPRFDEEALGKMKDIALTSLANSAKDPGYLANIKMRELIFPKHRYKRSPTGTIESVTAIDLQDIRSYFKEYITQDKLEIIILGDISEDEAKERIDGVFNSLPKNGQPFKDNLTTPQINGQMETLKLNIPQSTIYFMLPGIMYNNPDFMKIALFMHIIGGGQSSILFKEVREDRGLAYDASASVAWSQEAGYLVGYIGTKAEQAQESINVTKQVWERIAKEGITQEELDDAKTYMINSYPLQFTNSESLASMLLGFKLYGRPIDYFQKRENMINAITLDEMNQFIKKTIQPEKLAFVVVGKDLKG